MWHSSFMRNAMSPLGSVDKALQLIVLLRSGEPMSVKETAAGLEVAASTAHRLLTALTVRGFAVQGSDRLYRPGPVIGMPAGEPLTLAELREAAREPLAELNARVNETVQLMVLHGQAVRFVDGIEGTAALRVGRRIGDQMPAFVSAGGKAILAELSPVELDETYRGGLPLWHTSPIATIGQLRRQLAETRRRGFGTNFEETERGVVGLGVSVHGEADRPVAGITIALPRARYQDEDLVRYVELLRTAARQVEVGVRGRGAPNLDRPA